MSLENLFEKLWQQYSETNLQALQIHTLFKERGEEVVNDHIAFRTFGLPKINIEALAKFFKAYGYEEKGQYEFKAKKLRAKHYEKEGCPRVFISELKVEEFSDSLQKTLSKLIEQVGQSALNDESLLYSGIVWNRISWPTYEKLKKESEYASWLAVFGYVANHFTVSVNELKTFAGISEVNEFLKDNGFSLNVSGGEIKGTKEECLLQSSTLASEIRTPLKESEYVLPGCYYEFAERFDLPNGQLFNGFIAKSADKIFESTNFQD